MQPKAAATAVSGDGRASESGLLVLDEFLSFVDEVGDVVGDAPPSAVGFAPHAYALLPPTAGARPTGFAIPEMLPEPVPLDRGMATTALPLFGEQDASAFYQAMHADEDKDDSLGSLSPDSTSNLSWDAAAARNSGSAQFPNGQDQGAAETTEPPVKEKKKRRRRQKEELDYLRVRVKEMEEELTRLRGEDIASSAIAVGTAKVLQLLPPTTIDQLASGDESDDNSSSSTWLGAGEELQDQPRRPSGTKQRALWERVAHHQREETQKAVMENIKLRALLEGQLQVARSLETALRKKPRFASAELNPYIGKGSTIRLDGADEQKIYDSIGLQLDVLYAQVDTVLQSSGLADVRTERAFKAEVRADETGMFLEHKECRVVPFDVHAVGRAVWQTLGRESMPLRNGVYIARESTDDTVYAKLVDTFRLPKAKSETVATIRLVLKRFVEEDRVVSVWESVVETVGPVCLRLREKAWNVLKAHHVEGEYDADGEPKPMCIAHSIIRVWPEMASREMGENTEVGTLTNLVVGSYTRNLGIMAQIIQNLLTEETKKQQRRGSDDSGADSSP